MTRLSAAGNLIIDMMPDQNRWRILVNTDFVDNVQGEGVLMEAVQGKPLHYVPAFARTRRLPRSGVLPVEHIERVMLGWSHNDEAWHLGLVFGPRLSDARGSRWCELAKWPDPERDLFGMEVRQAGTLLANILGVPFAVVPVRERDETVPKRTLQLPPLPLRVEGWQFEQQSNGWLTFIRDQSWANERIRRALWYAFWTVIFIILAVATLTSEIAMPRPEFLPYLGLLTAMLMIGLVVFTLYELRAKPRRIIVDPNTRQIWGASIDDARKPVWRMGRESIDSVYVSHVVKHDDEKPLLKYGEINLRLTNGGFYYLLNHEEVGELDGPLLDNNPTVVPIDPATGAMTRLQAAGAYLGRALNVPVWYDHRVK